MRKVGIVGAAITEDELKARGEGFELWSMNDCHRAWPGVEFTRWYELHTIQRKGREFTRRGFDYYPIHGAQTVKEYLYGLDSLGIPVYMQRRWPREVRQSEVFPFKEIRKKWGDYFGCSFTWMMAQALLEGVREIGLFGITFAVHEYYFQRPSLERMIGYAEGKGIRIRIDESSALLTAPYIYAIGENFDLTYLLHGGFAAESAIGLWTGISDRLADAIIHPEGRDR